MKAVLERPSPATRWQALSAGLAAALPQIDANVEMGAILFPHDSGSQSCTVATGADIAPAKGNAAAIISLLESTRPAGGTPTAVALQHAANLLLGSRTSRTARAVVLATDGAPDCNAALPPRTCRCASPPCKAGTHCLDDQRTIDRISSNLANGILTYVIGIEAPGDTSYSDVLNSMAIAGGRPQTDAAQSYYAARTTSELDTALMTVSQQVGGCVFLTTSVPNAGGTIELTLDGNALPDSQWSWQERTNGEIVLGADLCQQLTGEAAPQLTAQVSCADN
jgi:hypothetical protein